MIVKFEAKPKKCIKKYGKYHQMCLSWKTDNYFTTLWLSALKNLKIYNKAVGDGTLLHRF